MRDCCDPELEESKEKKEKEDEEFVCVHCCIILKGKKTYEDHVKAHEMEQSQEYEYFDGIENRPVSSFNGNRPQ